MHGDARSRWLIEPQRLYRLDTQDHDYLGAVEDAHVDAFAGDRPQSFEDRQGAVEAPRLSRSVAEEMGSCLLYTSDAADE